jgi:hypothetical protein
MVVRRVEVEIQELVLHGFDRSDGVAVAESIERALGSQLEDAGGRFGESRAIERIDAPAIDLAAGASPRAIGGAVAERLHGSMRA